MTPVAVMIRPEGSCSHGCIYCPAAGLAPKSYTGFEPAARRGRQYCFDPFAQAQARLKQYEEGGHPSDKCELIIMGGTFLEMPLEYRQAFIKGVYDGLNGFRSATLEAAKEANETGKHRAVGLTIETRPDVCAPHIQEMLSYGGTRVELGVQHPDDSIYECINRGHTVRDVADATRSLKDAAFKVLYHIMPGLPGSGPEKDIAMTRRLFEDERFRPDMLKIYPTLVIGGTKLEELSDEGRFHPYSTEEAAETISEMYRHIPGYVRVMRIQRDIPLQKIRAGVAKSNLRELVESKIREKGIVPREIRMREIGFRRNHGDLRADDLSRFTLRRLEYCASGGREVFLSYEDQDDSIAGFVRLRIPGKSGTGLIRELHVYGSEANISATGVIQHRGLGSSLLKEAEDSAAAAGMKDLLVISGVGVREYYRKHGYSRAGPYMGKRL